MGETIILDQNRREVVRGAVADSIVTCTKTSAPDVYVNAIEFQGTTTLKEGDSVPFARMDRMRLHLFRVNPGDDPFSATLDISPVPPDPKKAG